MKKRTKRTKRKSGNFGYYVREGFRGFLGHGFMSLAAVTIIAACLLVTGSFSLVALNIDHNLTQLMSENEFLAYVDDSLSDEEAMALQSDIEQIDNVSEVTFISRSDAKSNYLESIKAEDDLYNSLPDSVLRHRYSIRVDDLTMLKETIDAVGNVSGIAETNAAVDVANGFVNLRNAIAVVAVGLVGVLLIISLFIVSNTIKLATLSRQQEIAIMKMCGATNGFIRMPFVVEGLMLGLLSSGIGFALQWALYNLMLQALGSVTSIQLIHVLPFITLAPFVAAIYVVIGLLVGICGSMMTIRKYLQV